MKKLLILFIIVVALFSGCNASNRTLSGEIVEVNYDSNAILIEEHSLNGLVWVGFDEKFRFSLFTSDELDVGNQIDIKIKPEILESYPMQAFGIRITKNQDEK